MLADGLKNNYGVFSSSESQPTRLPIYDDDVKCKDDLKLFFMFGPDMPNIFLRFQSLYK